MRRFTGRMLCLVLLSGCGNGTPGSDSGPDRGLRIEVGFASVPGGELYYEVAGSGEALVLIHGNGGDRRHWDHQFEDLAQTYQVVRYDVRGFGRSSLPVENNPYSDYDDLAALMDHLGIGSAHIAGWSMGSGIAIDFVLAYPGRARSLISVGPWVSGYTSDAARSMFGDMAAIGPALRQGGAEAAAEAWMQAPFFANTIQDPSAGREFQTIAADYSWWAFSNSSPQQVLRPSAAERTSEIRVPSLILTADHDIPACLEIADLLDESIPDSRKVVMQGVGHLLHMEAPEEFNEHVRDFLSSVDPA